MENRINYPTEEKKSKVPIVLGAIVIIGAIFVGLLFLINPEKPLDVITENLVQNEVSTPKSNQNPSYLVETGSSEALLDEEVSSYQKFTLDLEPGRYLFSFAPDARVLGYQEGRKGYARIRKEVQGDYSFDINKDEPTKFIIEVYPNTLTKIMLVQRARFR